MDSTLRRLVAAGAIAGFLTVGGVSLASAQDDPTTSTTVEDQTSTTDGTTATDDTTADDGTTDREDCPKDGADETADAAS